MTRPFPIAFWQSGASSLLTSLVAYYALSDTADATGRGNTLTNTGTVTFGSGKVGNAATFGGSNRLTSASTTDLTLNSTDLTICAWANLTTKTGQRYVVSKWSTGNEEYSLLYNNTGNRFEFYINNFAKVVAATTFGSPSTATWYFLMCYLDTAGQLLGISVNDGTVNTAATAGTTAPSNSQGFAIGAAKSSASSGSDMVGSIDEVGIWKRKLTSAEVTALYNSGTGITYPFTGT